MTPFDKNKLRVFCLENKHTSKKVGHKIVKIDIKYIIRRLSHNYMKLTKLRRLFYAYACRRASNLSVC